MRTNIKYLFLAVSFLLFTSFKMPFSCKIAISVTPEEASIFVDNDYKAKGYYEIEIKDPKNPIVVRIERPGYVSKTIKYLYRAKSKDIGFTAYQRGKNIFRISLVKSDEVVIESTSSGSESKEEGSDLSKLEALKQDALITPAEATVLKDKLLEKNDIGAKNTISELIKLRKILNTSFISKDQFSSIKGKILSGTYDFNKPASDAFNKLKLKSESGEYSKEDIAILKNNLLAEYK